MSWIQTFSGIRFELLDPKPEMVIIEDIAHALSHLCRFNGHTKQFYSVAQHSVLVSSIVGPEHALCGLLHDATEAYVGDMVRPLKAVMPGYKAVEQRIWYAIAERFNLPSTMPPAIKHADNVALVTERRDLLRPTDHQWGEGLEAVPKLMRVIRPMDPGLAHHAFLERFEQLQGQLVLA